MKDVSKVARTPCKPIRYRIAVHRFDREGKRQSINPTENDSFRRDGNVGKGGKVVRYETLLNCARREGREGGPLPLNGQFPLGGPGRSSRTAE